MTRILFLLKADQLGLFDTATMQAGYVNKHGTFVAPAATHRKKRAAPKPQTGDLFGASEDTSQPAKDALTDYIAKKGGSRRIASMLDGLTGEQRAQIIGKMASVGKTTAADVEARLKAPVSAPAVDDLFSQPAPVAKLAAPKRPATDFKYFSDFAKDRTGGIPAIGTVAHTELKAEWDAKAAAPEEGGFDSEKFDRERNQRIKASRDAGNVHVDRLGHSVESLRGKKISYLHGDEKGTITTADNNGFWYVRWDTGPYAGSETMLHGGDKKDYAVLNPNEHYDPAAFAKQRKKWGKSDKERAAKAEKDKEGETRSVDGIDYVRRDGKWRMVDPKEGDTKTEDGIEYQLKGGRWHKITQEIAENTQKQPANAPQTENSTGINYAAPFDSAAVPDFGVHAGVSKTERKRLNKAARDILHAKQDGFTDAEKATLAMYSGNGGVGDSLNEFYTRPDIAGAAWKILNSYGVDQGEVLEPSCGPGVFCATAPAGVKVVGVELDPVSARIATALHDRHEINQSSMEGFAVQDVRRFAGVVGNVPFGPRGALVSQDKPDLATAEQYFLDTAIDKTVAGGIVALIVPTGIMDNVNARGFRENLLKKAEFIGAHRMPNTSFEHSHTGVTTDLVIFRRRPDEIAGALSVLGKPYLDALGLWDSAFVSGAWFESHPERIYGKQEAGWRAKAGMGNDITVEGAMNGVADAIARDMPGDAVPQSVTMETILDMAAGDEALQRKIMRGSVKQAYEHAEVGDTKTIGGIQYVLSGQPPRWHRVDGAEVPEAVEDAEDLAAMLDELFERGTGSAVPEHLADIQARLSAYVKKHGVPANNKALKDAAGQDKRLWRLIGAVNKDGSFSSMVTGKEADDAGTFDGIARRMSRERGSFTVDELAQEWGHERDEVLDHLFASQHYAVTLAGNEWLAMDDYLSGNLWLKYDEAKLSASNEGLSQHYRDRYAAQLQALETAIDPKPLDDVFIELNSAWLPTAMIEAWSQAKVVEWKADNPGAAWQPEPITVSFEKGVYKVGGTFGYAKLIDTYLNRTGVRQDDLGTIANLNQQFRDWLLSSEHREAMEDAYNRKFRGFKEKDYSNTAIDVPGLNPDYALNDYHWGSLKQALDMGKGIIAADVGLGKAQPLDAKILTPTGWVLMGDIKAGDMVIAGDGTPTAVTGVFPQGEKEIFKVTMSDGASTECCDEHLWLTQTTKERNNQRRGAESGKPKVRSLAEIRATLRNLDREKNHSIPIVKSVEFAPREVLIDPYLLGVLIGDGSLKSSTPSISNPELEIIEALRANLPDDYALNEKKSSNGRCRTFNLCKSGSNKLHRNGFAAAIDGYGLRALSNGKFVPDAYKFNTPAIRIAMLQGLMDTDGYVDKSGVTVQYTSVSERLANDVQFLVNSLGGNATIKSKIPTFTYKGEKKQGQRAYTVHLRLPPSVAPFLHSIKRNRVVPKSKYQPVRYIVDAVSVGAKPAQCISVEHDSQLYVTDDFIVTHNTPRGLVLAKLLKSSGQAKKPTIVAPKSVLVNWVAEINNFFPGSKIMVIGENMDKGRADNEAERNAKYHELSQNDDYDFILISQPAFNDLDLNPIKKGEYQEQDFWTQRGDSLGQAGDKKRNDIRERYKQALAGRDFRKRADSIWFDELGVDALIVDEMHAFKNLYAAKARFGETPKFLGGSALSKRALDLNVKAKWLRETNGGKNIYGLTATPTTNSPLEIYSMLSHICPDEFESRGILNAEHFLDRYARFEQDMILTTSGGIKEDTVTAGFQNLGELRELMRKYVWRQTAEQVGLKLPARQDRQHLIDMSPEQQAVYAELRALAEDKSKSDTSEAHIFAIMSNMQKAATDLEIYDPVKYAGAVSPKYDAAAKEIAAGAKQGGQVVFLDANNGHEKMAQRLVAAGIPRDQIGIINADEAESGTKRQKISDDFNKGKLRVVIGNTATMGEGINLQKGTTDIHHLDLTWNPAGMQQRNGRGLRQGNKMEAVRIHSYLARGSFDGYRYQTIASKQNWQDALWNGGDTVDNFAREGRISDQDMKVMLAADPEEARAMMEANRALHDEIATEAGRARSGEVFIKFQDMKRTHAALKDKNGATARKLADRIEKARASLKHDKYFDAKEALDSEGDAIVQPKSGAVFTIGKAFEMQPGPSAPINYSESPSKWVVTGVNSRSGKVRARLYGGDQTFDMDIAKMAYVKPVKHDADAENAERSRAAVRADALKALKGLNKLEGVQIDDLPAYADKAAKAMIETEGTHGKDWHRSDTGKSAMSAALAGALQHDGVPAATVTGIADGLRDRAILAKYGVNPDEISKIPDLAKIPPELIEREMPMVQSMLKAKAAKYGMGSGGHSGEGGVALRNKETGKLEIFPDYGFRKHLATHDFPMPDEQTKQQVIDGWVAAQLGRKLAEHYELKNPRKGGFSHNQRRYGIEATYGDSITKQNPWLNAGRDLHGEGVSAEMQNRLKAEVKKRIDYAGNFHEALHAAMMGGTVGYDHIMKFDGDTLDALWMAADVAGVLNSPLNEVVKFSSYGHDKNAISQGVLYQATRYSGHDSMYPTTKVIDALNLFAKTAKYDGLPKTVDQIMQMKD